MRKLIVYILLVFNLCFAGIGVGIGYASAAGTESATPSATAVSEPAESPALEERSEPVIEPSGEAGSFSWLSIPVILAAAGAMIVAWIVVVRLLKRRR